MDAAKIRLAEKPPVACASCAGQYTDRAHVDFGSVYDGGMVPADENVAGGKPMSVDDLVICDECLRAAAAQIGLGDVEQVTERAVEQEQRADELAERLAGATAYIDRLEAAAQDRESLLEILKPTKEKTRAATRRG